MKIQQHNGVVVDAAGLRKASPSCCGRRKRCSRGREAPRHRVRLPSLPPPLYRPLGGALALGDLISQGGRRPGGVECTPRQVGRAPT